MVRVEEFGGLGFRVVFGNVGFQGQTRVLFYTGEPQAWL